MINLDNKEVVLGQGDVLFQAGEDLCIHFIELNEPIEVGSKYDGEDDGYEFMFSMQSSPDGWCELAQALQFLKIEDGKSLTFNLGNDDESTKITFTGDNYKKSADILRNSIIRTLEIQAEKLSNGIENFKQAKNNKNNELKKSLDNSKAVSLIGTVWAIKINDDLTKTLMVTGANMTSVIMADGRKVHVSKLEREWEQIK